VKALNTAAESIPHAAQHSCHMFMYTHKVMEGYHHLSGVKSKEGDYELSVCIQHASQPTNAEDVVEYGEVEDNAHWTPASMQRAVITNTPRMQTI
jgi:hypothetical protein